jgi:hypothetical protein
MQLPAGRMLHDILSILAVVLVVAAMAFREGRSDRADFGWLCAVIAAIILAAMTGRTPPRVHVGSRHAWNDLTASAGSAH